MSTKKITTPVNPNASKEVRRVLEYLGEVSGNGIITGQHTQTTLQPELEHIQKVTGKLPAICGFELLGYSPNIDFVNSDEECLTEVRENMGTLENAWDWANKKGLITFTWHWFSPIGGCGKAFYAEHTDFDPEKAIIEGTPEYVAMLSDMDFMAEKLKAFRDKNIPILWRPFHEADGKWFWWGSKSLEASKQLFRIMYDRYTNYHNLNNLIWVWNSPNPEHYPGDDVVDIISRDLYTPKCTYIDYKDYYDELVKITPANKLAALGEVGVIPGVDQLSETRIPWCWYMTWSKGFVTTEEWNSSEEHYKLYNSDYAITLDKLPELY